MKRFSVSFLSLILLLLPACRPDQKALETPLPSGRYAVFVSFGKTGSGARLILSENGDYELTFDDPASPLFGLKESVTGENFSSEYAGMIPAEESFPPASRLLRDGLRALNSASPESVSELNENNRLLKRINIPLSGGQLIYLFEKESLQPVSLEIQNEKCRVALRFASNND